MFQRLKELHKFTDDTVARICEQYPEEVQCRPGCADCCHAVFDISFIEAAYIADFLQKNVKIRQQQQAQAQRAAEEFEALLRKNGDLSRARIRCPFLADNNLCLGHQVRPINCRTYGTPTVIDGKGHVCGLSNFSNNGKYPTIALKPLQESLQDFSAQLAGEDFGNRRFPIAWVFLKTEFFLPR